MKMKMIRVSSTASRLLLLNRLYSSASSPATNQRVLTIPSAYDSLTPPMRVPPPPAPLHRFSFPQTLDPQIYRVTTCADPKIDVRIAACSNTNIAIGRNYQCQSPVPNLKIHSIRACQFHKNDVQSLNFQNKSWNTPGLQQKALDMAAKLVNEVLHSPDPQFEHLKAIWYPLGRDSLMKFYTHQYIKHSHHAESVWIDNYFHTAAQLCLPILSFDNSTDLRIFLYENGFETNRYHRVSDLIEALRCYFKVFALPTFTLDGPHVCFRESSVIYNLKDKAAVDHPKAKLLAKRLATSPIKYEFLMRRI